VDEFHEHQRDQGRFDHGNPERSGEPITAQVREPQCQAQRREQHERQPGTK
jgi:hypothetical protein